MDPGGKVVPGVLVTLFSTTTRQAQITMTDGNGLYGFSLLPPGTYDVIFSAQGFKTAAAMSVVVNVSEVPELDAQLEAGASDERVTCPCHSVRRRPPRAARWWTARPLRPCPLR